MQVAAPDLFIRPVDTSDVDEMRAFQRLYVEAERADLPDAVVFSAEDTVAYLSRPSLGMFYLGYAAFEDGRMVGEAMLTGSKVENLRTADAWVWVPPSERGRGVGSALLSYLTAESLRRGRGILQCLTTYPVDRREDHPYRRFAEHRGFVLANTEVERRLPLAVPPGRLDALEEQARPHHRDYRLRTFVGPLPADVAPGYVDIQNRLAVEAPSGDLVVEEGRRTPEILADQDRELEQQGRTRVTAVAIDTSGAVVAFSCAIATKPGYPHVDQWGTIVRRDDRGHRLGLAVKVALVRTLQDTFPDKQFVTTTNAETNHFMVSINETLGFEKYALCGHFQRIVPGFERQRCVG